VVVTREDMIPLFHLTYQGNMNDTKVFRTVIKEIKNRLKELDLDVEKHTLILREIEGRTDKGNLSVPGEKAKTAQGIAEIAFQSKGKETE
jgi:transposase